VARAADTPPPPGFERYVDAWTGFSVHKPQAWSVMQPWAAAVRFYTDNALVEVGQLPTRVGATPRDHVQAILSTFPEPRQVAVLRDEPEAATVRVDAPPWTGQIQVRLRGGSGLFVLGRARDGSDIHALCNATLASLTPVEPAARQMWQEPGEGSFAIACPAGWTVQHTFVDRPSGRFPWCRVFGGPATFVACELDSTVLFTDRPIEEKPEPQGFFASLGRMVENLAESMGPPPMPFDGMQPVIERYYVPRWLDAIPGSTLLDVRAIGPQVGFARMQLPDGVVRVVRVEGSRLPQMGPDTWGTLMTHFYQAPRDDLPRLEPILTGVMNSFVVNPAWQQREAARRQQQMQMQHQANMQRMQHAQALHQQRMAGLQANMNAANATYQAGQDVLDIQMQGWQARQGMADAGQTATVHGIHGTADYVGPMGTTYTGPEADRMWVHRDGETFAGGGPAFEMGLDWTELKKL
jgi:hypothetical protein